MKFESLRGLRLKGIGSILHKIFLIITYPIRHIFKTIGYIVVLTVILFAIPMTQGVSYKHVLDWYTLKYDATKVETKVRAIKSPEPIERKLKNQYKKELKIKEIAAPDRQHISEKLKKEMKDNSVTADNKPVRKTFKLKASPFRYANVENTWKKKGKAVISDDEQKADEIIYKVNNPEILPIIEPIQFKPDPVIPLDEKLVVQMPEIENKLVYRKIETLPLKYEDDIEHIEGKALVFNANEISVGDRYIILYGIYTNEQIHDSNSAYIYLKELIDNKDIECDIVAYTEQNYATAMCFIDGKSINQNMVDAGFAENIAL